MDFKTADLCDEFEAIVQVAEPLLRLRWANFLLRANSHRQGIRGQRARSRDPGDGRTAASVVARGWRGVGAMRPGRGPARATRLRKRLDRARRQRLHS